VLREAYALKDCSSLPLAGKTAVITGAGQNIGRAIALAFAGAGARVVVNGLRDRAKLDDICAEITAGGGEAMGVLADVSTPEGIVHLVETTLTRLGSVDIAVSNVGRRHHQGLLDITLEDWDSILRSNLTAAFLIARAALPHMIRQKWGRIIHISGRDGFFVKENRAHNVTAKAGLHALAKAISLEFGPFGVTANTVAPGLINTTRDLNHYPDYKKMVRERVAAMPAQRIGTPQDVAEACLYIASPQASFITGQLLHVNGGEYMY